MQRNTFTKKEKLCKKSIVDQLIHGKNNSKFTEYPLLCIWKEQELDTHYPAQIMISVGKRMQKKAINRNRIKRQIREIYRQRKSHLYDHLKIQNKQIAIIFLFVSKEMVPFNKLEDSIGKIIEKLIKMV
ncbi:MAG: ribonuclease P protein component [Bacteroidetes bacterium]|nr:ribonuclease P protein component [Bacteroidota bacterium]MBL6962395.1 ribonuclease P protein component [Bacteroidota bacterium]